MLIGVEWALQSSLELQRSGLSLPLGLGKSQRPQGLRDDGYGIIMQVGSQSEPSEELTSHTIPRRTHTSDHHFSFQKPSETLAPDLPSGTLQDSGALKHGVLASMHSRAMSSPADLDHSELPKPARLTPGTGQTVLPSPNCLAHTYFYFKTPLRHPVL